MYSLFVLFLTLPLYFSHLFSHFGLIIGESSSFERQKVYLFLLLILLACTERIVFFSKKELKNLVTYSKYILPLLLIPFLGTFFWEVPIDIDFFYGSYEKHHGYIWFALMTLLVGILLTLTEKEKTKLILANILSSSLVAILAILEYFHGGSVLFAQGGVFSWESLRAISTFGNPNYVAGYLLMSLPFLTHVRNIERSLYFVIIGAGIVVTGSYIGISLLLLYCIYRLLRMRLSIQKSLIFLSGICVLGGVIAYQFVTPDKLLSLKSRFVILSELWTVMVQYPLSFIIGFGPESIIAYFDGARSEIINSYFPPSSAIDSSHNIVFDFLFQYGIIPIIGVCFYLKKYWKKIRVGGQEGIILGILFFSLNVTVTVHMTLLLLYGLLYHEKKD